MPNLPSANLRGFLLLLAHRLQDRKPSLCRDRPWFRDRTRRRAERNAAPRETDDSTPDRPNAYIVERKSRELRPEAEEWQRRRTDFMMARLSQGSHSDTELYFWDGFADRRPPVLEPSQGERFQLRYFPIPIEAFGQLLLLILAGVETRWWWQRTKARKDT